MSDAIDIIIVDDEEDIRRSAVQLLDLVGFKANALDNAADALSQVSRNFAGVLVSDIRMPDMDGLELLEAAIGVDEDLPVILITGHGDVNLAVDAMRKGAYDFIEKPFSSERILDAVARAVEKRQLTLENRRLRDVVSQRVDDLEARLAGRLPQMIDLRNRIRAVAQTPSDVLLVGETGTGKEVAARAIHDLGGEKDRPFISVNCAAMSGDAIEAELFGYEVGAFAGATRARFGKFEHARNGTIFLDEIDAMPLEVQAKLLRVIEDRTITRLGSHDPIALNARFITATKSDLSERVDAGQFRADLLYRLNGVTIEMPTLRSRRDDIPLLFTLLANDAAARFRTEPKKPEAFLLADLCQQDWPGNVRELRNAAERFVLGLDHHQKQNEDLDFGTLAERMANFERETIGAALEQHNGQLRPVYEGLGISRKTLYEKMQRYGLDRADFKD